MIIELRDKLKDAQPQGHSDAGSPALAVAGSSKSPVSDAVSALIALGYKPQEASRMVREVNTDGLIAEEIIRISLQGAA